MQLMGSASGMVSRGLPVIYTSQELVCSPLPCSALPLIKNSLSSAEVSVFPNEDGGTDRHGCLASCQPRTDLMDSL